MISTNFRQVLSTAVSCAARMAHAETTVSHVVFILCESGRLDGWLEREGVDGPAFKDELLKRLAKGPEFVRGSRSAPEITPGLAACLHAAESVAASHGFSEFDSLTFFACAVTRDNGSDGDNYARYLFTRLRNGMEPAVAEAGPQVGEILLEEIEDPFEAVNGDFSFDDVPMTGPEARNKAELPPAITQWCTDLVEMAEAGKLDEVYGRDGVIDRLCKIMDRRTKNNPILLGEAGVGKTSVVEALAMWIASGRTPAYLAECRILSLDVGRIVAGTKYRGDLEERFVGLVDALKADPRLILFVDEIHMLLGADPNLALEAKKMKPALASGEIRCIGATTYDEYSQYIASDPAMVRRFQEATVEEPSRDDAVGILSRVAESYAVYHGVSYDPAAVASAVDLSIRYLVDRRLPDKAIDILDEAATLVKGGDDPVVTKREVLEVVRRMTKDPHIGNDDPAYWNRFATELSRAVVGHDRACAEISTVLRLAASNPVGRDDAKASVLLEGPKGAGKRHIARTVAELIGAPFLALEMSDYGGEASLSGLLGAKPGYVGYHDGGILTEFVRKNPMSVLYFDGIEAAHETVRNAVATAISEGFLKDSRGRMASFRNAVVFLSTEATRSEGIGFSRSRDTGRPEGLKDMTVDRVVRTPLIDAAGATELVSRRAEALRQTYARAGIRIEVGHVVVEAVATEGMSRGGKAWDFVSAFSDMVEAVVYSGGRGGVARLVDGKVVFDSEAEDALIPA